MRALVTQLSVDHKMLLEQICRVFEDLFGYALNSETVETALEQGYELAAAVEAATVERLKRAEVAHCDEKGSGEATLAAHRGQQPVYPSVCASQARGEVLRNATSVLKDERFMIASRPATGLRTWGVPGAHPARTAWSNGQG